MSVRQAFFRFRLRRHNLLDKFLVDLDRVWNVSGISFVIGEGSKSNFSLRTQFDSISRIELQLAQTFEGAIQSLPGFASTAEVPQRVAGASQRLDLSSPESCIVLDFSQVAKRMIVIG